MNLEEIDIHTLLPQQEPFVMVGRLTHFDVEKTVTRTTVKPDNIFVDNGFFTSSGIIENIAQTCAARIGYVNKYILRKGIQLGFIGAIRNLRLHRLPAAGQEIETAIVTVEEVFGMTLVTATVKSGDNDIIAECEMKIAVSEVDSQSV
jgi:Predicted 3-hydroxylacyl-(acyl carrier protein) dehydratase